MPVRDSICFETYLTMTSNLRDVRRGFVTVGRKTAVAARNSLASEAVKLRRQGPAFFGFTPSDYFVLGSTPILDGPRTPLASCFKRCTKGRTLMLSLVRSGAGCHTRHFSHTVSESIRLNNVPANRFLIAIRG